MLRAGVLAAILVAAQINVDVQEITVNVSVDDASKRPVTNLAEKDFTIFEDGQQREISNFASAETPYNILLLFDRSSSTQDQWDFLLRAVSRFVTQLPDQHRIALAAFDDKPEMIIGWMTARDFARQPFRSIPTDSGGTDVYKAIEWGTAQFKTAQGRKGIILLTDGVDNRLSNPKKLVSFDKDRNPVIAPPEKDSDFQKVLRAVEQNGTLTYFIAVNTDRNLDERMPKNDFDLKQRTAARERMEIIANRSNGAVHFPKRIADVGELYEKIGRELGNAYSLSFRPGRIIHDGSFHPIEVRAQDKTLHLTQSREGYNAQ